MPFICSKRFQTVDYHRSNAYSNNRGRERERRYASIHASRFFTKVRLTREMTKNGIDYCCDIDSFLLDDNTINRLISIEHSYLPREHAADVKASFWFVLQCRIIIRSSSMLARLSGGKAEGEAILLFSPLSAGICVCVVDCMEMII